jgi:hypothetical protein
MNDLKDLLARALDDAPPADAEMDPAADLIRGRSRLLYRRRVALAGAATVALGVAIIPVALNGSAEPVKQNQASSPSSSSSVPATQPKRLPGLALVAYTGEQVPGYRVASVPEGWKIQGGDAYALAIVPKGFKEPKDSKEQGITSYVGKLVVMLQSRDAPPPTQGKEQLVDGRPGRLDVQGDVQMLTYQNVDERWMVIQAPTSLGWNGDQIAEFASGVEVLGNAEASRG